MRYLGVGGRENRAKRMYTVRRAKVAGLLETRKRIMEMIEKKKTM